MRPVSRGIDRVAVTFDEPNLVANAGLVLVATLAKRLGLEKLCDATIDLRGRVGGFRPGRKILTLVHAMVAGASHIDHADLLRAGATAEVLDHRVMAPSTLGTFLRSFTFGHVRQFERVIGLALGAAWAQGAGPGGERLVVDIDSTIDEVHGKLKAGAAFGYTKKLGYHPILATRASTGEILHARMRKGSANTQRGIKRFIEELVPRLRRAGAEGQIVMRFDSGFWSKDTIAILGRLGVNYTMAVRTGDDGPGQGHRRASPRSSWTEIDYPEGGRAEVAECTYNGRRLIVRRTRLVGPQAALWPDWRHFAFLTDLEGNCRRARRLPPPPRRRRAGHRRPEGGCGHGALPLGQLLGQRRVAVLRGARPQPDPLDGGARRARWRTTRPWSSPGPCAPATSPCPAGSSTAPAGPPCACHNAGPGHCASPGRSPTCAPSPSLPPERGAGGRAWPQTITHTLTREERPGALVPRALNALESATRGRCCAAIARPQAGVP